MPMPGMSSQPYVGAAVWVVLAAAAVTVAVLLVRRARRHPRLPGSSPEPALGDGKEESRNDDHDGAPG